MKRFRGEAHAQTFSFTIKSLLLQNFEQIEKQCFLNWDPYSRHFRYGLDYVGVWRRFKRDQKNDGFLVGKKIVVGAQRTVTMRNTDPRLVYFDEGRDPGRDPPPPSRGKGIETREDP